MSWLFGFVATDSKIVSMMQFELLVLVLLNILISVLTAVVSGRAKLLICASLECGLADMARSC